MCDNYKRSPLPFAVIAGSEQWWFGCKWDDHSTELLEVSIISQLSKDLACSPSPIGV